MKWLAITLLTAAIAGAQTPPTDNPVAAFYAGAPAWTDQIAWGNVRNMATYANGATAFQKFENARDELVATGGGVLYYPAGTYDFSSMPADGPAGRGLLLKSGVVIRGETNLTTKFVFGMQTKGGGKVPRDWNFIGVTSPLATNVGICWVNCVGATVYFGPQLNWASTWGTAGGWQSALVKSNWLARVPDGTHPGDPFCGSPQTGGQLVGMGSGRLVFGCKFEDAAVLCDFLNAGAGTNSFFMYKFGPRIAAYGSRVFIANNVLPASTNNFKYTQTTCTPSNQNVCVNCAAIGTKTLLWDYGKTLGIDVNKELLGIVATGYYTEGVIVRDNYVFNHGHKGFGVAGQYVTLANNHNERVYLQEGDDPYGLGAGWELTQDGYRESTAGGNGCNSDNLSRAFDLAGRALWIDGNTFNNTGSNPGNDGEGVLCQAHAGTQLNSWAITHNVHTLGSGEPGYFGGYDVDQSGCLIAWNSNPGSVGSLKAGNLYDCAFVSNVTAGTTITTNGVVDVLTNCPAGVVNPPVNVVAALSNDFVRVTWTDASTNEIGFRVQRSLNGGAWQTIAYRPRHSLGNANNEQAWNDYTAPSGQALSYRVVAVNCADDDTGASAGTVAQTIPLPDCSVSPWSVGPVAANWESAYQARVSSYANAQTPWAIPAGNADTDDGKRTWSPLLAEMWKVRADTNAVNAWITGTGSGLLSSTWAGQFYKAFSDPGYAWYYLKYKAQLPAAQRIQVSNMLYSVHSNSTPCGQLNETGWQQMRRTDDHMDPIYCLTEFNSENFNWMARLTGALLSHDFGDTNQTAYFDPYVNNWVRALFNAGRVEWNSDNYWGYTFSAALTFHEFAPTPKMKAQAKAALDWMALEAALHYLDGFQAGADVRAKDNAYKPFVGSVWPYAWLYFHNATFSDATAIANLPSTLQMVGFAVNASYRPPQVVLDIANRNYALPVEIQSAKPYYDLDNNNYSNWLGNTTNSRRFEFETIYHDTNYLLGSVATYRPDGSVGTFSEQSVWRLAVKGTAQVAGNAGTFTTIAGRCPQEEIGQYRNVMLRLIKGTDRLWVVVTNSVTVATSGGKSFADLGNGVYVAFVPFGNTNKTSQAWGYDTSYTQHLWWFPTNQVGALVLEVGTAAANGSFANFTSLVSAATSPLSNQVQYVSTAGRVLKGEFVPWTTYTLKDGTFISKAGVPPKIWRDGTLVDFNSWNSYQVATGSNIVTQAWGGGALQLNAGGRTLAIHIDPVTAAATYSLCPLPASASAPIELWRFANFGASTNNPTIAGDLADPDGDGIVNLLEYALNLNPNAASVLPGGVPDNDHLTLTYTRRKPPTDITYLVEVSGAVTGTWANAGVTEQLLADDGTFQSIKAADPATISGNPRRFMHLKVTRP